MDLKDYLKLFDEETQAPPAPMMAANPTFPDQPSTGQDNVDRQKMVEDAVKAKRWSLIPQVIAGIGDTLAGGNKAYGVNNPTNAAEGIRTDLKGRLEDTSKQFEAGLQNNPTSDASKQYQNLLGRFLGKDPSSFANMSAAQIKDQIPAIEKLAAIETKRQPKAPDMSKRLQIASLMQNRELLDQDRDAKRALSEQQQLEGKVQKHSTEMQKANMPELVNTYNELQDVFASGGDVAGIGAVDSHVPGFMLSPEGIRNRTNLQQMANSLLKSRSGAAVSDQEYKRFLLELQAGNMPTEKAIKAHLGKMGTDAKTIIGQLEAGLPSAAMEEYKSHPGSVTSADVNNPSVLYQKPSAGEVKRKTADGRIAIFDSATKKFKRYE